MTFFTQLKCAFCPRWSCHARYKIGNRTYYSHLGFVSTQCPKKLEKDPFYQSTQRCREKLERNIKEYFERKKEKEQQEKQAEKKTIVVVDDNMQFAEELTEFIKKSNKSDCLIFTHPEVLLKYLEHNHVDIIVTDYEMPGMNGCELAIKVLENFLKMRIVIMSGHDEGYLEQVCKRYELYGKVEVVCKGNIDFFRTLVK